MSPTSKLKNLRKEVDSIDKKIIELIAKRFRTTNKIQGLKREFSLPITQKGRESSMLKKYLNTAKRKKLPVDLVKKLFLILFYYSKKSGIIRG